MTTVAHQPPRGYRTLRLPLAEADYEQFISNGEFAKGQLDQLYGLHPELFPEAWDRGMCSMALRHRRASNSSSVTGGCGSRRPAGIYRGTGVRDAVPECHCD